MGLDCYCQNVQAYVSLFIISTIILAASFSADSEEFIFRRLVFLRRAGTYKFCGSVTLFYTRAKEIMPSAFDSIGLPS